MFKLTNIKTLFQNLNEKFGDFMENENIED